ncbi:MAG: DUF1640 domain-containing protein [Cytophagales bacterium]|nr:DUF1640 domain-containing protein [Cytophagales bacterium]
MNTTELDIYELLKLKLGEKETKALFSFVGSKIEDQQDTLATKLGIEKLKAELLVVKWMLGVVLAGIISLVLKAFLV